MCKIEINSEKAVLEAPIVDMHHFISFGLFLGMMNSYLPYLSGVMRTHAVSMRISETEQAEQRADSKYSLNGADFRSLPGVLTCLQALGIDLQSVICKSEIL